MKKYNKILILFLILSFLPLSLIKVPVIILEDIKASKTIFIHKISPNDQFTMHWMHSVELAPWEETFYIDNNYKIILDYTRFKAFGAGVPKSAGKKTFVKNGWIYFAEINKEMPNLAYGISNFAKHTFYFKNITLKLYEMVPNDNPVKIYTDKLSIISYIYKKLIT
ncbi:DUF1850 domain-containing protein [Crassaminicella thermophila]|uniref:DUF1850 domain-containing protein n=1 Tax=Crassaminicella thermophila TaxID=2599308 RepID=A0A5C0SDL9_CRATE|nr:DUF1850 domain-containing protein [Crassaminicella thermophila]QEK11344.1 DUF1850 domain-containing protein [Crassaminicella thermophila]